MLSENFDINRTRNRVWSADQTCHTRPRSGALRWSDLIERRREELSFLRDKIELTAEPEDLTYLRRTVGQHLPNDTQPADRPRAAVSGGGTVEVAPAVET